MGDRSRVGTLLANHLFESIAMYCPVVFGPDAIVSGNADCRGHRVIPSGLRAAENVRAPDKERTRGGNHADHRPLSSHSRRHPGIEPNRAAWLGLLHRAWPRAQRLAAGPLALVTTGFKYSTCGQVTEILDTEEHGYHAEVSKLECGTGGEYPRRRRAENL